MNKPKDLILENIGLSLTSNYNIRMFRNHSSCNPMIILNNEIDSVIEYLKSVKQYIEEQNKPKVGDYGTLNKVKYIIKEGEGDLIFQPLLSWQVPIKVTLYMMCKWKKEGNIYER